MEFKREYLSPEIQIVKPIVTYHILEVSDGVMGDDGYEGKKGDFEDEIETGIPDSYTSIWGDEEEKED